ncbi:MAG: hypothetical protein RBR09_07295 [Desulfobulbaceae bacterium]|jgi:PBP1b-binding outer membrane lipoprotein LpoB|nr:hypothetical protein [Desulfobulbaceae bacterium]
MRLIKSALTILIAALMWSCSNGGSEEEKGKIQTMTEEIGQEGVRMIKTPIDKAQAAADQEEQRVREMDRLNKE